MQFNKIIGQDHLKKKLRETVKNNRVAHAQLFYGGEGVGKLPLAIAYAQFINCKDENKFINGDSCGTCPSCNKYNKLIHPDLHFVFPIAGGDESKKPISSNFLTEWLELLLQNDGYITLNDWYQKIEIERKQAVINVSECNQIIQTLNYTSYESDYKVMIIWMVEKLYYVAAPKLLKILEEPPDKTLFLLIAEHTEQIINTIMSRLLPVKIPRIDDDAITEAIKKRFNVDDPIANQVAQQANGSFTEAVSLLDQSEDRKANFDRFKDWMRMCWTFDAQGLLDFSEKVAREGRESNKSFLQFSLVAIRTSLALNYTKYAYIRIAEEERVFYENFSPFVNHLNIVMFTNEFNKAINHIERNVHSALVFFDLSLTIVKLLKMK